ncbi:GNAT family N-acetyltransferase [Vagococcus elongatus]|uniref:N-acetyltransferase domain-containing protein n=1 Tax=Vagococcus elongatus TaxID=180344 RepID=A0A430AY92_9ENTE|nr:GNAT family protein [Vagococcus elongatus]RSU13027.1 hypothetical protein CBF29_04990 [Vagococcus elongatus]
MIETDRLFILPAFKEDIDTILAIEHAPENRNFIFRGTREEHLAEIHDPSTGICLIKTKKNRKTIGFLIFDLDKASEKFELRRIAIVPKNQGYGTESLKAVFKYAFEKLEMNKVWLDVYTDNLHAISLYEKLGMQKEGILRQNHKDECGFLDQALYSLLKNEYFDLKSSKISD